jgi:hypothetical protein
LPSVQKDLGLAVAERVELVAAVHGDGLWWLPVGLAGEQVFEGQLLVEMVLDFHRQICLDEA